MANKSNLYYYIYNHNLSISSTNNYFTNHALVNLYHHIIFIALYKVPINCTHKMRYCNGNITKNMYTHEFYNSFQSC